MQSVISSRTGPFGREDLTKLEDLFIFSRGQPINLTIAGSEAYKLWQLWRKGIKPWEYNMSYDQKGNPIVYKDDIDLLLLLDSLNERGAEHERKKQEALEKMQRRMSQK
jgi:hypothetical protein